MKNILKGIFQIKFKLLLLAILISSFTFAERVNEQQASIVATNFLKATSGINVLKPVLYYKQVEPDGSVNFYVFNFLNYKGFVIVTGDDILEPVIAYSTESAFDMSSSKFIGISDWINGVNRQIGEIVKRNLKADQRIADLWVTYKNGVPPSNSVASAVLPLLTTTWDQSMIIGGVEYYNSFCPFNSTDNARCFTGCVATAMAQIMKYWNSPSHGTGSNAYLCVNSSSGYLYGLQAVNFAGATYNWAQMPDQLTAGSTHDVDLLMYHCGVSVNMDYGDGVGLETSGSGASTTGSAPSAEAAYENYFDYRTTLHSEDASNYSSTDWINLLKGELDTRRPIHYRGDGTGGHSWVCDGYDVNNLFHMNWGWGGGNNGYFSVASLNPGSNNFSNNQRAIIGIWPNSISNCANSYNITNALASDYTYQASNFITASNTIYSNINVTYTATNNITLLSGFQTSANTIFNAKVQPCMTYKLSDNEFANEMEGENQDLIIYPNPADNFITFKIPVTASKSTVKVYNSTMQLIKTLNADSGIENRISVADLPNGIYFIDVQNAAQNFKSKFVVSR